MLTAVPVLGGCGGRPKTALTSPPASRIFGTCPPTGAKKEGRGEGGQCSKKCCLKVRRHEIFISGFSSPFDFLHQSLVNVPGFLSVVDSCTVYSALYES